MDRAASSVAADARALDTLRAQAKQDPEHALKDAARQFESLFMHMLLKSMRDALPQGGDPVASDATRTYTGMLDQQLSQSLSGKGLGLADMMVRQLSQAAKSVDVEKLNAEAKSGKAPQAFVDRMLPHATEAGRTTGVPPRFILGQAALESGWGRSEIPGSHNLFGIKAGSGWKGATVDVPTTEYVDGKAVRKLERFRAYGSYAEGFRDWAQLVAGNPRYAAALAPGNDAAAFARALAKGGYATDPAYAVKLTRTIHSIA
jgi:flagellar protein FlgJ